jgi:hypothetical protein
MTRQNDLSPSAAQETAAVAQTNVIDIAAYAARRKTSAKAEAEAPVAEASPVAAVNACGGMLASAQRSDTDMLIQAMRALAIARARLDRLSREAAECRRKLESIKLG